MEVVIDKFGRIVLPRGMRARLGVNAGSKLILSEEAGRVILQPAEARPQLVRNESGILVLTGVEK